MRVLVACEFSGKVRNAFRAAGHDAWSCDLLPADDGDRHHIQGDVLSLLNDGWDMMIAHPPCTYLCNSGVCWLHKDKARWALLEDGATFFKALLNAPIPHKAIENPIMHKYARALIGRGADQTVQPWMFGHGETKATCFWLVNMPLLVPTNIVSGREQRLHRLSPGPMRWKERSTTYQGIADAMARQWGGRERFYQPALFEGIPA